MRLYVLAFFGGIASVCTGDPNGNLRQDYLKAALVADSQEIVDVDMREIVAPLP